MVGKNIFIFFALFLIFAFDSAAEKSTDCNVAEASIKASSRIRGLSIRRSVPCTIENKEAVKKYLLESLETKIPATKLKYEEILYKAVGFLPKDFDYVHGVIDLYVGQLGGYYDPETARYVMAGWIPNIMQPTIAVHELTHALQDQYYNLKAFIDPKLDNSDLILAHSALVEGDATAVMIDYNRELVGQQSISNDKDVEGTMMQNLLGASITQGMGGAPQGLQLMLLFPYTSGLRFAHTLLREGGFKKIDYAFTHPPNSTEEILHPEKFLAGIRDYRDIEEKEMEADAPSKRKVVYQDTLGEFFISSLLGTYLTDKRKVASCAAGWGGDRAFIYEGEDGKRSVLWKIIWDTEGDAKEFFEAYSTIIVPGAKPEIKISGKSVILNSEL